MSVARSFACGIALGFIGGMTYYALASLPATPPHHDCPEAHR